MHEAVILHSDYIRGLLLGCQTNPFCVCRFCDYLPVGGLCFPEWLTSGADILGSSPHFLVSPAIAYHIRGAALYSQWPYCKPTSYKIQACSSRATTKVRIFTEVAGLGLDNIKPRAYLVDAMALREELRKRKVTYAELGRRIHKHEQTIAKYARGALPIPPDVAMLISFATGIPLAIIQGNGKEA